MEAWNSWDKVSLNTCHGVLSPCGGGGGGSALCFSLKSLRLLLPPLASDDSDDSRDDPSGFLEEDWFELPDPPAVSWVDDALALSFSELLLEAGRGGVLPFCAPVCNLGLLEANDLDVISDEKLEGLDKRKSPGIKNLDRKSGNKGIDFVVSLSPPHIRR